jgi:hypothetical protein
VTAGSGNLKEGQTIMDETEETVRRLQNEFDRAEQTADLDKLRALLADDFRSIGPKGFVLDKDEWIGRHVHFTYQAVDTSDMDIRVYDNAAIVRNVQRNRATYRDEQVALTVRVGQVWVKQQQGWRMAAIQFSPMPQEA